MSQKNEPNKAVAICMKTAPGKKQFNEGMEVPCNKCTHLVWLSDSTISAMKQNHPQLDPNKDLEVMCMECAMEAMRQLEDPKFVPPTQTQLNELFRATRPDDSKI